MKTRQSTIVFHIGFHKTGSTSLQQFFASNESTLRSCGIRFPQAARERCANQIIHSNLPWQILQHSKFDPDLGGLDDLASEIRREPGAWIVTTEGLSRLTDASPIRSQFADAKIKVIAYYRNPLHAAPSLYTEHLKFGTTKTWIQWADASNLREWFNYEGKLAPWRAIGCDVSRRHLEETRKVQESGLSIFEDFVALLPNSISIPTLDMSRPPQANSRISFLECAALYAVNHAIKASTTPINQRQKVDLRNTARRAIRRLFPEFLHPFSLDTVQQERLRDTLHQLGLFEDSTLPQISSQQHLDNTVLPDLGDYELALRREFRRIFPPSFRAKPAKALHFLETIATSQSQPLLTPDARHYSVAPHIT